MADNEAQWEKNVPEEADAYPCEERKGAIDNDNPAGSNLIGHLDPWRRNVTEEADERKEIIDKTRSSANEMIEFRPGRDPKEAIEGDLIRFLYKNHDNNSVSWVQGRLVSRLDKLEDAIKTEWKTNRFTVDITNIINYWGDPGITPSTVTVNISHGTQWALGLESS